MIAVQRCCCSGNSVMRHFSSKAKRFVVQNQVKVQSDSIFLTHRVLFYEYMRTERVETDLRSAESWSTLESLIKNTDLDQYIFLERFIAYLGWLLRCLGGVVVSIWGCL